MHRMKLHEQDVQNGYFIIRALVEKPSFELVAGLIGNLRIRHHERPVVVRVRGEVLAQLPQRKAKRVLHSGAQARYVGVAETIEEILRFLVLLQARLDLCLLAGPFLMSRGVINAFLKTRKNLRTILFK